LREASLYGEAEKYAGGKGVAEPRAYWQTQTGAVSCQADRRVRVLEAKGQRYGAISCSAGPTRCLVGSPPEGEDDLEGLRLGCCPLHRFQRGPGHSGRSGNWSWLGHDHELGPGGGSGRGSIMTWSETAAGPRRRRGTTAIPRTARRSSSPRRRALFLSAPKEPFRRATSGRTSVISGKPSMARDRGSARRTADTVGAPRSGPTPRKVEPENRRAAAGRRYNMAAVTDGTGSEPAETSWVADGRRMGRPNPACSGTLRSPSEG